VSWLPPFHDMGLVGFILEPLYIRAAVFAMSPIAFLQRPVRWLRAITRYRGTLSGAPNFAFDLCVRRVSAADKETLDLGSLKAVGCAAEPIRTETLRRFAEAFGPCGFDAKMFFPCYGLAESTLIVTGARERETPTVRSVDRAALRSGEVREVPATAENCAHLVGCGEALLDETVHVVDPDAHRILGADEVGEIWVSSPSVGAGYWGRPDLSAATFGARLDGSMQPFLRTAISASFAAATSSSPAGARIC
jgi:acyl-CoA synthetase (AMP-forming)/AMP-acid ligase II